VLSVLVAAILFGGPHCDDLVCVYGAHHHHTKSAHHHQAPGSDLAACPAGAQMCATSLVAVPKVSTKDAVEMALATIEMPFPRPRISPGPRTWVNLETRLWIQHGLWRTYRAEATVTGQTVTLTGRPVRVVWELGDGREICASTECSHTWRRSSSTPYEVTATVEYLVQWSCTGACDARSGTVGPLAATGRTREQVREIQTVSLPAAAGPVRAR
jgi:hypothetical protein